jgi:pimeloyl-ACP methyl ester carboxylesterase
MHRDDRMMVEKTFVPHTSIHRVDADGVTVFYREAGPSGTPVAFLLHGFPTSSFQYRELIPRIADWAKVPHTRDSKQPLLEITRAILVLAFLLTASVGWSQTQIADQSNTPENAQQNPTPPGNSAPAPPSASGTVAVSDQAPSPQDSQDDSKGKQTKRMLWVVPNFGAVDANTQLPPMSTREKFVLAAHDSVLDYSSYTWAGMLAGQAMLLNSDPELGHGIAGYGRYYWRTFVDGVSGTFFTEAIVPTIAHEDPRYYTMGEGGFFHRTGYAISRAFVTKTDSGGTRFNFSEVVGNGLEAGLSNAYYPPQERGLSQTAANWGTQMESAVLNHVFQEFWPDIRKKVFRQK